jgi:hypothetical protein
MAINVCSLAWLSASLVMQLPVSQFVKLLSVLVVYPLVRLVLGKVGVAVEVIADIVRKCALTECDCEEGSEAQHRHYSASYDSFHGRLLYLRLLHDFYF